MGLQGCERLRVSRNQWPDLSKRGVAWRPVEMLNRKRRNQFGEFRKLEVQFGGGLGLRVQALVFILFRGLCWGPLLLGTYHVDILARDYLQKYHAY